MNVETAYKAWSEQYDSNENKTRDLEGISLRETLGSIALDKVLEIGCGTGKNTVWLAEYAKEILAVDLTPEMLEIAKSKVKAPHVKFQIGDITQNWDFAKETYDLAVFSLVLEHVENLDLVFEKLAQVIKKDGFVYIGELHPFKQYAGSKARFNTSEGEQVVTCFNHHVSDFTEAAQKHGFAINLIKEYFDDQDKKNLPRILTILFKKLA
jgi:ubiquinone/menaquinone biosynthesis C-methylase UbiE